MGMEVSSLWNKEVEKIAQEKEKVIILGATDTGKTTLVRFLAEKLVNKGIRVALIDSDIGQSLVGPPT